MEFAVGIGYEGNELVSYAVDKDGKRLVLPLKDLAKRGLPKIKNTTIRVLSANFEDWQLVNSRDYIDAFGFSVPQNLSALHQCFLATRGDVRITIPALALMRALFRPHKHLLPGVFGSHALDRICRVAWEGEVPRLHIHASWFKHKFLIENSDCTLPLSWMMAHRSAFEMISSVHDNAMSGCVGLSLPFASAFLKLKGLNIGKNFFVTEVVVVVLTPLDPPELPLLQLAPEIRFRTPTSARGKHRKIQPAPFNVPQHSDGTTDLTDDEWVEIGPIVRTSRRYKFSQRDILNRVLSKTATNVSWMDMTGEVGIRKRTYEAFRGWSTRGVVARVAEILSRRRSAPK